MTDAIEAPAAVRGSLRREWPFLLIQGLLLAVLLHANAPEVWFWFAALVVLLLWRWLAWWSRRRERLEAAQLARGEAVQDPGVAAAGSREPPTGSS